MVCRIKTQSEWPRSGPGNADAHIDIGAHINAHAYINADPFTDTHTDTDADTDRDGAVAGTVSLPGTGISVRSAPLL